MCSELWRDWGSPLPCPWQVMSCRDAFTSVATLSAADFCALCMLRLENSSLSEPAVVQAAIWKSRVRSQMYHPEIVPKINRSSCADAYFSNLRSISSFFS